MQRGLRRLVPACGRPGLSPDQLATVCVLQFLLSLSDRQAAEAVRCRIDFKTPWPWSWTTPASTTAWSTRTGGFYGRPVRLGKNPTKPKTRILDTGNDAVRLLEDLYRHGADRTSGPRIQALRQIMVQN
ncbi:transposase [Streptomyces chartreusis]|uniref:transposase n=1 Tax=Streptomyces chartreusis TaxID=1969 RepID=UPI0036A7923E